VVNASELQVKCEEAMNDDLNTPIVISLLFDGVRMINSVYEKRIKIDEANLNQLKEIYSNFVHNILGLPLKKGADTDTSLTNNLIESVLNLRQSAKERKEWDTADEIRDALQNLGITIKDRKDGFDWEIS
jgi:cysteinyl-tRNA synthetase